MGRIYIHTQWRVLGSPAQSRPGASPRQRTTAPLHSGAARAQTRATAAPAGAAHPCGSHQGSADPHATVSHNAPWSLTNLSSKMWNNLYKPSNAGSFDHTALSKPPLLPLVIDAGGQYAANIDPWGYNRGGISRWFCLTLSVIPYIYRNSCVVEPVCY